MAEGLSDAEFAAFEQAPPLKPPARILEEISAQVFKELNPSPVLVFVKLAVVVFVVGILNLTLCPQFGLSFARSSGLMEYFMSFGKYGCRVACGAFFLGSGLIAASMILSSAELKVALKTPFLQLSLLSALNLVGFVALGGDVYLDAAIFWFVGSVFGGLLCLEFGYLTKRRFLVASAYR